MKMNVFTVLFGVVAACALSGARETGQLPAARETGQLPAARETGPLGAPRTPEEAQGLQEAPDTEHARYKRLVGILETILAVGGKILHDSALTLDSIGLRQPQAYGGYEAPDYDQGSYFGY